ncbi:MAG: CDP-glycerol glycerophosphotransferase family protein [Clostridiales bacterium]|nr:CDP-glycerol glycerophosphotransferase family protein [Clostridiales bacterium]
MLLYIDPGTGSMLFAVVISIVGFLAYIIRVLWVKLKFVLSRGKKSKELAGRIPLLIFAESKRYWQVFKPICEEISRRGVEAVYWTTSEDDPAFESGIPGLKVEFIGKGNKAYAKLNMVCASVLVSSTPGLNVYQWKKSKLVDCYIHVNHAANEIALYRMFGIDFYDAVLISGEYQEVQLRELERKRDLPPKEVCMVGIPYMDAMRQRSQTAGRKEHKDRCVLLAPSWGPNSIFNKYGTRVLDELVKTDYDIIVRPHPQSFVADPDMMKDILAKFPETDKLKWDRTSENFNSLQEADILISDFSGIVFDFTLAFDKPVVYTRTDFNTDCYDHYWLDRKTIWTDDILPYLGLELNDDNVSDIKNVIDACLTETRFKEGRDKARSETWECMGEGAKRTVDFILGKCDHG